MTTSSSPFNEKGPELLQAWADLGATINSLRRARLFDWGPALRMIAVASQKLQLEAQRLKALLDESSRRLQPLEDPFAVNLGTHRWLSKDREESYSDWLQWVVEQLATPELVFGLFGLHAPEGCSGWRNVALTVHREFPVPFGHVDRAGRLDLVIWYEGKAVIVVEVKTVGAEDADTAKQRGYASWLEDQHVTNKGAVLIATHGAEAHYEKFELVTWAHVCVSLRQIVPGLTRSGKMMIAAMILAFVGAVEQNLLGFDARLVKGIVDGRVGSFNSEIVDHLARYLDQEP